MLKKTVLSTSVFVYCCQPWFSLDFCAPIRIQGYLKAIADGSVCGKLLKDNREEGTRRTIQNTGSSFQDPLY